MSSAGSWQAAGGAKGRAERREGGIKRREKGRWREERRGGERFEVLGTDAPFPGHPTVPCARAQVPLGPSLLGNFSAPRFLPQDVGCQRPLAEIVVPKESRIPALFLFFSGGNMHARHIHLPQLNERKGRGKERARSGGGCKECTLLSIAPRPVSSQGSTCLKGQKG